MRVRAGSGTATLVVAVLVTVASCSTGANEAASPPTTVLSRPTSPVADAGSTLPPGTLPAPDVADTLPGEELGPVTTEPAGVPGLDSDVPFCRAYVTFAGSLQVLLVAMSFGTLDSAGAATLEVIASPAVLRAAASTIGSLPGELAPERDVLAERVIGPLQRRAERAVSELGATGATGADLALLEEVWLAELEARDASSPDVRLPALPAALQAAVEAAAAAMTEVLVPLLDDPTLVRDDVTIPLTNDYVARECPEARAVVVGDSI